MCLGTWGAKVSVVMHAPGVGASGGGLPDSQHGVDDVK